MSHIDVTAGIIWKGEKFLITKRFKDDPTLPGLWEFPGGKLEEGETLEECLERELKEELEIEVIVEEQILVNEHEYPNKNIRLHFYDVEYESGDIKLNAHSDYKWITPEEIDNYEFPPADIPVLEEIKKSVVNRRRKDERFI